MWKANFRTVNKGETMYQEKPGGKSIHRETRKKKNWEMERKETNK